VLLGKAIGCAAVLGVMNLTCADAAQGITHHQLRQIIVVNHQVAALAKVKLSHDLPPLFFIGLLTQRK
jgi:hypothetical protein